jgi:Uma2 family endonuclease
MSAAALVSVQEYLNTTWHPDRDFVDGEVVERTLGEFSHGRLQLNMGAWLRARENAWRFRAVVEVRLQITTSRFRIPDVMLVSADAPREQIVRTPPLVCIEILSPDDSMRRMMDRLDDYFSIGVPVCWVVDPVRGCGWIATRGNLAEVADGVLRAGVIEMPLAEVLENETDACGL